MRHEIHIQQGERTLGANEPMAACRKNPNGRVGECREPIRYLSLFSGIEACSVAWKPLGWVCAGVAEIEPFPTAVLAHHYPDVPNLGDVTAITDDRIAALGRIDLVVGGSPCQDLSVAGKRKGLAGVRSGLFHEQLRIFHAARTLCGARWLVWENVPGAFSSHRGRDFAVVVGAMAGLELAVPADGWGSEGMACGENGLVEWCVLDAQWFGLAQRRRRVFAVLDTGNWADRPPVLLEPDGLRGDSAPRREAGERPAVGAEKRAVDGGAEGAPSAGAWPADVACTLNAAFGSKQGLEDQHALGGGNCSSLPSVAMCLNAGAMGRQDAESETLIPTFGGGFDVAHTLRGDGFDASEDGTGRGTPLVPVCYDTKHITSPGNWSSPKPGDPCHPLTATAHVPLLAPAIAFGCKDSDPARGIGQDVSPTLRAMQHDGSHANAGGQVAVAFAHQGGGIQTTLGYDPDAGTAPTLAKCQTPAVHTAMAVRRLTPIECERLQGFPDDYTRIPWRGKPADKCPDGPRYKALGNSMATTVMAWMGQRIAAVMHEEAARG